VAFSPGGDTILTGSRDKTARLWDLKGNTLQVLKGHTDNVWSVAFSPGGDTILTGSWDKTARLWDLKGNILQVLKGHTGRVTSVAFSTGGDTILTGSNDKTARLWDLKGNTLQVLKGHNYWVMSVAFSPGGDIILTGSRDKTARLWDLKGNTLQVLKGHTRYITSVAFSPGGDTILTGSRETLKALKIIPRFPELVALVGGRFFMGSKPTGQTRSISKYPKHEVTLAPFAIGKYEVTNAQFVKYANETLNLNRESAEQFLSFKRFIKIKEGSDDISGAILEVEKGYENYPANGVSWKEAKEYCEWLKETTGIPFRLPTEAEWEYACRGGANTLYSFGDNGRDAQNFGWFSHNSNLEGPREVGAKYPNRFVLFDMHGNLWEWCLDGWTPNYKKARKDGLSVVPKEDDKQRVIRGGSYQNPVEYARSASRNPSDIGPVPDNTFIGFRVVASLNDGYIPKTGSPRINRFTAFPKEIEAGKAVMLEWRTENAERVRIMKDNEVMAERKPVVGNFMVFPGKTTTYTLEAINPEGEKVTEDTKVIVLDSPDQQDVKIDDNLLLGTVVYGFRGILDRLPYQSEVKLYTDYIRKYSTYDFCRILMTGEEYQMRKKEHSSKQLAISLYQGILEREPDIAGLNYTVLRIEKGLGYGSAAALLESAEFRELVERKPPAQIVGEK
jgi:formylglycine-generating enzyme required for sulfatase activity